MKSSQNLPKATANSIGQLSEPVLVNSKYVRTFPVPSPFTDNIGMIVMAFTFSIPGQITAHTGTVHAVVLDSLG